MKRIISFFARKSPTDDGGQSFVRLQVQEPALAAPMPIAIHYHAQSKLKIRKVKK